MIVCTCNGDSSDGDGDCDGDISDGDKCELVRDSSD